MRLLAVFARLIRIGLLGAFCTALRAASPAPVADARPIRIGILHSLTGSMALSERSLVDGAFLAIDEINKAGGVLGRRIEPLVEDGAADPATFARKAETLIRRDAVCSIFGCWTADCQLAVRSVVEKYRHLLWYPLPHEGGLPSSHIVYTGETANQQLIPALQWALERFGSQAYLVGSDDSYPHTANQVLREALKRCGGECVGESYQPMGRQDFSSTIDAIRRTGPDFVLSTVAGDSNLGFYRQLNLSGISAEHAPVIAFAIAEDELRTIGSAATRGHYCSWSYFQSLNTAANRTFVRAFKQRYGERRVTDSPIQAAYTQIYLFAAAVRRANSTDVDAIRAATGGLEIDTPGGRIRLDATNHHAWKYARVGQVERDGQIRIVWSSPATLPPTINSLR